MEIWGSVLLAVLIVYVAVCFGRIAGRNGKNPVLWGALSVISPINLIILGIWAFCGGNQGRRNQ